MLRHLLLLITIAVGPLVWGAPEIVWLDSIHNFGAFNEDLGQVTCQFRGVNVGDEALTVLRAAANCGCTTPRYTRAEIAPGDTLDVEVSYNAKGRPGAFEKHVYVYTNTESRMSTLTIRGTVIGISNSLNGRYPVTSGKMRLSTTVAPFGQLAKGEVGSSIIRAYNHTADTIRPVATTFPGLTVTISPYPVPPGEPFVFSATLNTSDVNDWGVVTDTFYVASEPGLDPQQMSSVVILLDNFSKLTTEQREASPIFKTLPEMIDLDRLGAVEHRTVTLDIYNGGASPLVIHKMSTPSEAIKLGRLKHNIIKPGKKESIKVEVDASRLPAGTPLNARITFITNDPSQPMGNVRVVGQH